jgi:ribosomal protein S18 acetylase RimI-like enzyme
MAPIEYFATGIGEVELIRDLWTELNAHHRDKAGMFRDYYDRTTFETRKVYFLKIATTGIVRLFLASDRENGRVIGYLVCSLSSEHTGEIESVFVTERYRCAGVGSTLITLALSWLDGAGSERNRVSVADGNEEAFAFYRKFDFYPRMTVLEQKKI